MPKTVRALALAALFVVGGSATAHAGTGAGSVGAPSVTSAAASAGRTVAVVQAGPCMAC